MALAFFYFFCSFQNPLPWTICDPSWSTNETCYGNYDNLTEMNLTGKVSSAEAFFVYQQFMKYKHVAHFKKLILYRNYVLKKIPDMDNGLGAPDWRLSLCLLLCWILIFGAMFKGVLVFNRDKTKAFLYFFFIYNNKIKICIINIKIKIKN